MTTYKVGPVKPWVQSAADYIGTQFGVQTIYGFGTRDGPSDHALGLALDFMVYGDAKKGQAIADYCQANFKPLDVYYIIFQQHIWDYKRASEGWRLMPDRGSITANHFDHVHVSFNATFDPKNLLQGNVPGIEGPFSKDGIPGLKNAIPGVAELTAIFAWIGNGHNWFRVLLVLSGAALLIFALLQMKGQITNAT